MTDPNLPATPDAPTSSKARLAALMAKTPWLFAAVAFVANMIVWLTGAALSGSSAHDIPSILLGIGGMGALVAASAGLSARLIWPRMIGDGPTSHMRAFAVGALIALASYIPAFGVPAVGLSLVQLDIGVLGFGAIVILYGWLLTGWFTGLVGGGTGLMAAQRQGILELPDAALNAGASAERADGAEAATAAAAAAAVPAAALSVAAASARSAPRQADDHAPGDDILSDDDLDPLSAQIMALGVALDDDDARADAPSPSPFAPPRAASAPSPAEADAIAAKLEALKAELDGAGTAAPAAQPAYVASKKHA